MVKDREAWCTVAHGVAKSQIRPSNWTTTATSAKESKKIIYIYIYILHSLSAASVVSDSVTLWIVTHQAQCPWDSPGKNTGVSSQGIFPTQGIKLSSPALQVDSLLAEPQFLREKNNKRSLWWWLLAIINCLTEFSSLDNTMSNVLEKECALGENKERRKTAFPEGHAVCHIIHYLLCYPLSYLISLKFNFHKFHLISKSALLRRYYYLRPRE